MSHKNAMRIRQNLHGIFIESRILLVILAQPLDLACFYIVYSAGDLLFSEQRILLRGKGRADLLAGVKDIQMTGRAGVFFLTDGFANGIYDVADVSVGFAIERCLNGAAAGMTKDDDEGYFQMGYGVLDGAELVSVDHISCDADGKKLAQTAGEDDFGDDAGVRTGDDHSAGRLPNGQGETFLRGNVSGKNTALYIRGVSFFECLQNDF